MRIISKFHDYYDSVSGLGYDPKDVLFLREKKIYNAATLEKNYEIKTYLKLLTPWEDSPRLDLAFSIHHRAYVFFCGKVFLLFVAGKKSYYGYEQFVNAVETGELFSSVELTSDQARASKLRYEKALLHESNQKSNGWCPYPFNKDGWSRWMNDYIHDKRQSIDAYKYFDVPVMMLRLNSLELNPCLTDVGFASHVDPYTAYQEIDMFLSNELAKQLDPVPERTQDLIRDAHGFDNMSFKTYAPGDKKQRRRENKLRKKGEHV